MAINIWKFEKDLFNNDKDESRTNKQIQWIDIPRQIWLFVDNGLFVNDDLHVDWAIDLQISSHKNKGYEQNLTHRKKGPKPIKCFIKLYQLFTGKWLWHVFFNKSRAIYNSKENCPIKKIKWKRIIEVYSKCHEVLPASCIEMAANMDLSINQGQIILWKLPNPKKN